MILGILDSNFGEGDGIVASSSSAAFGGSRVGLLELRGWGR